MMKGETVLSGAVDPHLSEFQVMRSNAGWYVGTIYTNCGECTSCVEENMPKGFQEPGSRETGYFDKEEDAEKALATYVEHKVMPGDRQSDQA